MSYTFTINGVRHTDITMYTALHHFIPSAFIFGAVVSVGNTRAGGLRFALFV